MNAAVVTALGANPGYSSFADPVAGEGEKLVTVTAAALHPIVKALASGTHYGSTGDLPFIPGVDGAGLLEDGTRAGHAHNRTRRERRHGCRCLDREIASRTGNSSSQPYSQCLQGVHP